MKFLSLFSGIGGIDLGLERAGMQCVGQVEINPFCQRVLAHHWPEVKRIGDIRNVNGTEFGAVDLICGGFPCQPFSTAGKRKGKEDDRYLWPEMLRVIQAYRPAWIIGENVTGIVSMALGTVLSDLEAQGYKCQSFIIPACAVDAPHQRNRVWILGYSSSVRSCGSKNRQGNFTGNDSITQRENQFCKSKRSGCKREADVPDADSPGCGERRRTEPVQSEHGSAECAGEERHGCRWLPESGVGRVAHGVPGRVDRLRSLGNAVVPQVVEIIGRAILSAHLQHGSNNGKS